MEFIKEAWANVLNFKSTSIAVAIAGGFIFTEFFPEFTIDVVRGGIAITAIYFLLKKDK